MSSNHVKQLFKFIENSPSCFHAIKTITEELKNEGFVEIKEKDTWQIEQGKKYYVTRNLSSVIAFKIPQNDFKSFNIVASHSDSPTFKIKENAEIEVNNKYVKLNTEKYGGMICSTWFDRPLSIAGRILVKENNAVKTHLVNIDKDLVIIPNLAIHMNREVNDGFKINRQKDTLPLLSLINEKLEKGNYLLELLAKELNVSKEAIIDFELYPYEYEKGCLMGLNEEFISSGRLDDLAMVHAGIEALISADVNLATNIMIATDNEEVGSSTKQGGDSEMLSMILERIVLGLGKGREDFLRAVSKSFLISADLAHAVHPNVPEKHDPTVRPVLNGGPVIKIAASQSYATDSDTSTAYELICRKAGVNVQRFVNRSDLRGGSTIGPISSTHLPIRIVDMGTPILSMHSIRELAAVKDHSDCIKSFEEFYKI